MTTVSLIEAQSKLSELVHQLASGEEVVITENKRSVAHLLPAQPSRTLGTLRGSVVHTCPDFDASLDDFGEYMP
ncbi:MAG: type II toxin-antitoxin system Phd/YefM family antitoxin [Planctomycetaceae bacterium]